MSPAEYLIFLRMAKAKELIRNTKMALGEIAFAVGIENLGYFTRQFKRQEGMTPQEYRELATGTVGVPRKMISETVERILFYIHNNFREQISLKTMAQDLYISENIIRTLLAETMNTNFKDILSVYRLHYAEALLVVTDMPILDVSLASGFNSERTFTRLFKERNGITPSAYRAMFTT